MNNVEKERKKLEKTDLIIIGAIIFTIILTIIGTIIWVNQKYNKEQKAEDASYISIANNKSFKYKIDNNKISFFNGKKIVDIYTCINSCEIKTPEINQFTIDYDSFIPIYDNNKYIIYNIDIKSNYYIFDTYPEKTLNKNIGIVTKNSKKGLINKNGSLILNTEFNDIEITENYVITLQSGIVNVYNNNNIKLTNNEIMNIYQVIPLEKDNKLYLYLTNINGSKTVIEYNSVTKTFS